MVPLLLLLLSFSNAEELENKFYSIGCSSNFILFHKENPFKMSCPDGLVFDVDLKTCNDRENVMACHEFKILTTTEEPSTSTEPMTTEKSTTTEEPTTTAQYFYPIPTFTDALKTTRSPNDHMPGAYSWNPDKFSDNVQEKFKENSGLSVETSPSPVIEPLTRKIFEERCKGIYGPTYQEYRLCSRFYYKCSNYKPYFAFCKEDEVMVDYDHTGPSPCKEKRLTACYDVDTSVTEQEWHALNEETKKDPDFPPFASPLDWKKSSDSDDTDRIRLPEVDSIPHIDDRQKNLQKHSDLSVEAMSPTMVYLSRKEFEKRCKGVSGIQFFEYLQPCSTAFYICSKEEPSFHNCGVGFVFMISTQTCAEKKYTSCRDEDTSKIESKFYYLPETPKLGGIGSTAAYTTVGDKINTDLSNPFGERCEGEFCFALEYSSRTFYCCNSSFIEEHKCADGKIFNNDASHCECKRGSACTEGNSEENAKELASSSNSVHRINLPVLRKIATPRAFHSAHIAEDPTSQGVSFVTVDEHAAYQGAHVDEETGDLYVPLDEAPPSPAPPTADMFSGLLSLLGKGKFNQDEEFSKNYRKPAMNLEELISGGGVSGPIEFRDFSPIPSQANFFPSSLEHSDVTARSRETSKDTFVLPYPASSVHEATPDSPIRVHAEEYTEAIPMTAAGYYVPVASGVAFPFIDPNHPLLDIPKTMMISGLMSMLDKVKSMSSGDKETAEKPGISLEDLHSGGFGEAVVAPSEETQLWKKEHEVQEAFQKLKDSYTKILLPRPSSIEDDLYEIERHKDTTKTTNQDEPQLTTPYDEGTMDLVRSLLMDKLNNLSPYNEVAVLPSEPVLTGDVPEGPLKIRRLPMVQMNIEKLPMSTRDEPEASVEVEGMPMLEPTKSEEGSGMSSEDLLSDVDMTRTMPTSTVTSTEGPTKSDDKHISTVPHRAASVCISKRDGLYSFGNCSSTYYSCINGVFETMQCHDDMMIFDGESGRCEKPSFWSDECKNRKIITTTASSASTTESSEKPSPLDFISDLKEKLTDPKNLLSDLKNPENFLTELKEKYLKPSTFMDMITSKLREYSPPAN